MYTRYGEGGDFASPKNAAQENFKQPTFHYI